MKYSMKKISITLQDIFDLPGAEIVHPELLKPINMVSIDSRTVKKGGLYVAIKGEKHDGHTFVESAFENGASAVMIKSSQYKKFSHLEKPLILVSDTVKSLGDLAKVWRSKLDAMVIAITGSNGKTGTKDYAATILSSLGKVTATVANNNNHIGVPLTLFSAKGTDQYVVAEAGTNHFGEIPYTAAIAQPDIALITNIGDSHLEFLQDRKGVLKEKSALFDAAAAHGGLVVVNIDDPLLKKLVKRYPKVMTYGTSDGADVKGVIDGPDAFGKTTLTIQYKKKKAVLIPPVAGWHNAFNVLAACAAALAAGAGLDALKKGVAKLKAPKQRLNITELKSLVLIDDTYNANPASMKAGIEFAAAIYPEKRRYLVLGDMFELGADAVVRHQELAKLKAFKNITMTLTVGKSMLHLNEALVKKGMDAKHFSSPAKLLSFLSKSDFQNAVVLVKGSRGMKMETYVPAIIGGVK